MQDRHDCTSADVGQLLQAMIQIPFPHLGNYNRKNYSEEKTEVKKKTSNSIHFIPKLTVFCSSTSSNSHTERSDPI